MLAHRDAAASWSFFRPASPPRNRHVHVTSKGSSHERVQLLFVDCLRNHELASDAYAQVKSRLAIRFADDREGYTRAKTDFIFDMLDRAEQWAAETGWTETEVGDRVDVRVTTHGEHGVHIVGRDCGLIKVDVVPETGRVDPTGVFATNVRIG